MEKLTNNDVKELVALERKKGRSAERKYLIFGMHLIKEAAEAGVLEKIILVNNEKLEETVSGLSELAAFVPTYLIDNKQLNKFKSITTVPNQFGVCRFSETEIDNLKVLGINNIKDPGNLGTIIRTARAFGINNIILDEYSVDLYNPKVIQAAQGAHFHMNIVKGNLFKYAETFGESGDVYLTYLDEPSSTMGDRSPLTKFLLILGNESEGIEDKFKKLKYNNIKIDIEYESLNVAVAAGILMYQLTKGE